MQGRPPPFHCELNPGLQELILENHKPWKIQKLRQLLTPHVVSFLSQGKQDRRSTPQIVVIPDFVDLKKNDYHEMGRSETIGHSYRPIKLR